MGGAAIRLWFVHSLITPKLGTKRFFRGPGVGGPRGPYVQVSLF